MNWNAIDCKIFRSFSPFSTFHSSGEFQCSPNLFTYSLICSHTHRHNIPHWMVCIQMIESATNNIFDGRFWHFRFQTKIIYQTRRSWNSNTKKPCGIFEGHWQIAFIYLVCNYSYEFSSILNTISIDLRFVFQLAAAPKNPKQRRKYWNIHKKASEWVGTTKNMEGRKQNINKCIRECTWNSIEMNLRFELNILHRNGIVYSVHLCLKSSWIPETNSLFEVLPNKKLMGTSLW